MANTADDILAAIDLDAARSALASIGAQIDSMAFTAPEMMGGRLTAVADNMNELATALCLIKPKAP